MNKKLKRRGGIIDMQRGQKTIGSFQAPKLPVEDKFGGLQGLIVLFAAICFMLSCGAGLQSCQSQAVAARPLSTSGK